MILTKFLETGSNFDKDFVAAVEVTVFYRKI